MAEQTEENPIVLIRGMYPQRLSDFLDSARGRIFMAEQEKTKEEYVAEESEPIADPQVLEVPLTMKLEIYWPSVTTTVGIVYLNGYNAHGLYFHRVMPQDAEFGVTQGWWRMEEQYFLSDDALVEAIKKKAEEGLMSGRIRMHYAGRE